MSSAGDAGQQHVADRHRRGEHAVRSGLWGSETERPRLPVERGEEVRRRDAGVGEPHVAFGFRVPLRDLEPAHQRRHPVVGERVAPPGVLRSRPDRVPDAGGGGRPGQVRGLGRLPLGVEVLEERRQTERAVRSVEGADQAVDVVQVGAHHGGASVGQRSGGGRVRGSGDRPAGVAALRIGEDGPGQSPAGGPRGADHGDDLGFGGLGFGDLGFGHASRR